MLVFSLRPTIIGERRSQTISPSSGRRIHSAPGVSVASDSQPSRH